MAHLHHWMGRGPSSKLTGFISGLPSKCLVSLEYWKVLLGQQDTTANISPNFPGCMFLHAVNTDSQYWLAGINGDAAVERDHYLPTWSQHDKVWFLILVKFWPFLPLFLCVRCRMTWDNPPQESFVFSIAVGPIPEMLAQVKCLLK